MKRYITLILLAAGYLTLIKDVHGVGKTIVRAFEINVQVPSARFVGWFRTGQWRYARAFGKVFFAKCFPRKRLV
jgi:hypothetical protein